MQQMRSGLFFVGIESNDLKVILATFVLAYAINGEIQIFRIG